MLDAALEFARAGLHVFPVEAQGKHPIGRLVPKGKLNATTDEGQIRAWWDVVPDANIGISCAPSGLVVLDVDPRHGGDASMASIAANLPPTLYARTGGGGWHLYYRAPPGEPIQRIGILPGLDLIGNGYVLAPPSLHASGQRYAWACPPGTAIAPLPDILRQMRRAAPAQVVTIEATPIAEGNRNNALFRLGCALRDTGLNAQALRAALLAENTQRFKPPLPELEVYTVTDSVMTRVSPRRDVAADTVMVDAIDEVIGEGRVTTLAQPASDFGKISAPPVRRYKTGIPQLDHALGGGISTRQLAIIMAPPADGKSALAVTLSLSMHRDVPVLYASTELEGPELAARLAAQILDTPWRDIVDGKTPIADTLAGLHIHVIGCERLPMGDAALPAIDAEIQRITVLYDGKPPMVVVDYLQDLARGTDEKGVKTKIGTLAMQFRAMSQRLDCPLICISSVSRSYYGMKRAAELRAAEDATAYLAAAKESGDVDYAAAVVVFLDVVGSEPGTGYRCARLAVAKSRHGETGFVGARFYGASGRWQAAADEVVQSAGKREAAQRAAEHDQIDAKVLTVMTQCANEGAYYTAKAWRGRAADGLLGPELTDNAVREALSRLVGSGRVVLQRQNPHTMDNAPGGGEYVIARGA